MASDHKNTATITIHVMHFPSTPLPAPPSLLLLLLSEKGLADEMVGPDWLVLKGCIEKENRRKN